MFAGFGSLGATFYSRKAKNGVLRVNFGAVAAGTPIRPNENIRVTRGKVGRNLAWS
jgi:hypothetical protein